MNAAKKNWFITGISSGLGKALAEEILLNGDFVIGTFRQQSEVDDFNRLHGEKALALKVDITNTFDIKKSFEVVKQKINSLDVLVNNAGIGFAGAIEETSDEETRTIFETNFFSVLEITRTFLPLFRAQKSGHIIQISSHGGVKAFAGFGIYNASKFALEGFSEALAQEILPLGIKLTIVEPGPFRTNFAAKGLGMAKMEIEDYSATAGIFRERMKGIDGKQEGDPLKAAKAIVQISKHGEPPLRLPLGKTALVSLSAKIESLRKDLELNKKLAEEACYS